MTFRATLARLRYRWHLIRHSGAELNRRVAVEQQLLDAATGKRPLPDATECRRLALQLGVPEDFNPRPGGQVPPKAPPPPRDEHEALQGDPGVPPAAQWCGGVSSQGRPVPPHDPLDTPLPCDVTIGGTTLRKGVPLRALVIKAKMLNDLVMQLDPKDIMRLAGKSARARESRDHA